MREALLLCDSCCGDCGKNERVFQMNTAALPLAATFCAEIPFDGRCHGQPEKTGKNEIFRSPENHEISLAFLRMAALGRPGTLGP